MREPTWMISQSSVIGITMNMTISSRGMNRAY